MSEVKLNLIDTQQVLHGTIHASVVDSCVAALSAEPETIAELVQALARYIKPLDDHSPFATFHSRIHSSVSSSADPPLDTEPWDAGIVVIDLAARIVAVESTYSMPEPSGEVRYHDGTSSTDIPVLYRVPDDWLFVNSVEAYQWSRERRAEERLTKTPLDAREVLYGAPLLNFIVDECRNIDVSAIAAAAEHPTERATCRESPELKDEALHSSSQSESAPNLLIAGTYAHNAAEDALTEDAPAEYAAAVRALEHNAVKHGPAEHSAAEDAVEEDAAVEHGGGAEDAAEDALATEISNIHARWLMTPREDLRGHSPREVLLARQDFIDFDMHTRSLQWSFLDEGPPCLPQNSYAYQFAGFGTHEFVIYYDLVRHLIWSLVADTGSPRSNVQSPMSDYQSLIRSGRDQTLGSRASSPAMSAQREQVGTAYGSGRVASDVQSPTSNVQSPMSATQAGMSQGQEGGHAPALLRSGSASASDSGSIAQLIATLDQIKTNWLESPQPDYGGRTPAILIDNERKRLPEAMRPRDMIIDEDCPMCQMFGDETTPLGMGVGFWHLDGCNMDDDFAFSSYKTRAEWEAENRRRDEFSKEFNRKWEERQQRIARGEILESDPFFDPDPLDPFFDPDPLPDSELDDSSLMSTESIDDNDEFPQ